MKKLIAALLMVPSIASAEFMSGNSLLRDLKGDALDQMIALGYVMGVMDVFTNATVCPPNGVTAGQVQDIIKKHLEESPGTRHYSADSLIRNKLERTWPCLRGKGV